MAIFIGLRFWINWHEFNQEIETAFENVSARIATSVNPTIWDIYKKSQNRKYSNEVANAILDAELKDPHLVAIKVYGNFGHLFMGKIKLPDGRSVDFDDKIFDEISPTVDRHLRYPIHLDQMTIGNVEIYFTEAPLRAKLLRNFLIDIAQTLVFGLVTVLFLFYALRKSLVKPLIALQTAKHAIESMSDGVAIMSPEGKILEVNNAFCQQTGYDIEDVFDKDLFMFKNTPEAESKIDEIWEQVKSNGIWAGEVETLRKNSSPYPAMLSFTTVHNEGGEIINRVLVIRDNTSEHRLQHSQRMETVGALAGGIAHDINNVLTPIMGWAELLSDDMSDEKTAKRGLQHILKGTERAKGMIDQIMNFSRMNKNTKPSIIDLKALILDSIGFIRATFPASLQIETNLSDAELKVFADPGKIEQVLINLYTNAMHAMEEKGGVLTISAKLETTEGTASHELPQVHIAVSDTGHGIPAEVLDSIFEPYFTTKGSGKGNGFGLSTSLGIINLMEGNLQVETTVGVGSTFHIRLPAIISDAKGDAETLVGNSFAAEEIQKATGQNPLQGLRVLLVDDEVDNLKLGENLLMRLGCQTECFADSREALAAFNTQPDQFDIVMTDQSMPFLQGDELTRAIRALSPTLPILVISGHDLPLVRQKYQGLDGISYIRKPFHIQDLKSAMIKLIATTRSLETQATH